MKPDKDPLEPSDVCYCAQELGLGVKAGFWHLMEVLSLPYTPDLSWPNTTAFQVHFTSLIVQRFLFIVNMKVIRYRTYIFHFSFLLDS